MQTDNISFGQKYPTAKILEITSRKIFDTDGVSGYIETLKQIHGNIPRYTGNKGYKYYAEEISKKITANYPEIKQATEDILDISSKHRIIFAKDLGELIKPVLNRFDKEIDIVI